MVELLKIVNHFELKVVGDINRDITKITSLDNQLSNGLTWAKSDKHAAKITKGTILINKQVKFEQHEGVTYIITEKNAKLVFSLIMKEFFNRDPSYYLFDDSLRHRQNPQLKIADNVFLELHDADVRYVDVAINENGRMTYEVKLNEVPAKENYQQTVTDKDVFLVAGGGRGVTATCIKEMNIIYLVSIH